MATAKIRAVASDRFYIFRQQWKYISAKDGYRYAPHEHLFKKLFIILFFLSFCQIYTYESVSRPAFIWIQRVMSNLLKCHKFIFISKLFIYWSKLLYIKFFNPTPPPLDFSPISIEQKLSWKVHKRSELEYRYIALYNRHMSKISRSTYSMKSI